MKWTFGPIGSCSLLVAGGPGSCLSYGHHDAADSPSVPSVSVGQWGTGAAGCCGGRGSSPAPGHPPVLCTGCAPARHRGALCGRWSKKGDLVLLLCLFEGASGRGALRSVTPYCANRPLQRDAHCPPWAGGSRPGNQRWGLSVPFPGQERGQSSQSPLPTGPREVLGSSVVNRGSEPDPEKVGKEDRAIL